MRHTDYRLGPEGIAFVKDRLKVGNTLARCVLREFLDSDGEAISRLPENVEPSVSCRFKEGGVADSRESIRWFVDVVRSFLMGPGERLVVCEDALARRGDPILRQLQSRMRFVGQEVYHLLVPADASDYAIQTTLSESEAPHQFVCILTYGRDPNACNGDASRDDIPQREIEAWARSAQAVIVGAYDAEGFILWRPRGNANDASGTISE